MADRIPIMAGNWKMHKTAREGAAFVEQLTGELGDPGGVEVVVAPAFTGLQAAVEAAGEGVVRVAAQDVFWEESGAYTGEVSPSMLADLCVKYVIIGHSERRQIFGETDEEVARKVRAAIGAGLIPIMCVGEIEAEREEDRTEQVLERQVLGGSQGMAPEEVAEMVVAYEPVWAIGTGRTATPQIAQDAIAFIRSRLAGVADTASAERTRILYGGSVKPDNVADIMAQADIDGALVGGASLAVDSFKSLVRYEHRT